MDLVDQIIFWTEISKEHPIVINKFAELSDIMLTSQIVAELFRFSERFENIQNEARILKASIDDEDDDNWRAEDLRTMTQEVARLVRRFVATDRQWISMLRQIGRYGQYDAVFQTLIQHIIDEQTYAYNVITTDVY